MKERKKEKQRITFHCDKNTNISVNDGKIDLEPMVAGLGGQRYGQKALFFGKVHIFDQVCFYQFQIMEVQVSRLSTTQPPNRLLKFEVASAFEKNDQTG